MGLSRVTECSLHCGYLSISRSKTMAAIRKFFEKTKIEAKFKLAGEGHKLTDTSSSSKPTTSAQASVSSGHPKAAPSAAQQKAAAAALSRLEKRQEPSSASRSAAIIRAQALKELEAEKKRENEAKTQPTKSTALSQEQEIEVPAQLAVDGVYYKCPLIGPEVLSKSEMTARIKDFLYEQLNAEEGGLTACLLIHTANNQEKVQQCVETLFRYLDNIIAHPSDEKYRKIRAQNKVFQEKVANVEGSQEFLRAVGFELKRMAISLGKEGEEPKDEDFWILPTEKSNDIDALKTLRDALVSAEPIRPELDRGLRVLLPSQATRQTELPPDFFRLTTEELKREQQLRSEQVERSLMLRTKAMRERDEKLQQRKYRYSLIRVKLPDGLILQGVFNVNENLQAVYQFVEESLDEPVEFTLTSPTSQVLEETSTLLALNLVPAAVLHFKSQVAQNDKGCYLKSELIALVQEV